MVIADAATPEERRPWLGLASFTEVTQELFFGREDEVAELERRVRGRLLTVLFGKSGLGKTSILQAGLVPRLRARGYFPVYLRIDYAAESPEPAAQIWQAIEHGVAADQRAHTRTIEPQDSIWELLHRRDDALKDAAGQPLAPLLIFDQFEELFTLAQSDERGRARAARFIGELADLVENRPPRSLEERFEADETAAENFDFSRDDYRVVITLREDYLAQLESLKRQMPSLSQNRLRLAPMTGNQALEAVLRPGQELVSEEVAAAIVRFVAGGSELANAEVEPSLLSLICRELNEQRIAQRSREISLDLLAGSHESILSGFYERSVSGQPYSVRRIIEDELLTESGYRENLAEERVLRRFHAAGAASDALTVLVNRRLLRIEERLDVRRVELTHDVLSGVVKASRDQRLQREAQEATERVLTEQRERESMARRALRRARAVAAGCTVLAAAAVMAAALAFVNVQRARRAEADARQTRIMSEQGRAQAERLLGFLTDDFVRELESFGRYRVIADLSSREIVYFRALPAALKEPQTIRNGSLALENHAGALLFLGDPAAARANATEAIRLLESLRHNGDRSDATTIALGRAYAVRGATLDSQAQLLAVSGEADSARAASLLRPIAEAAAASVEARRAYLAALVQLGAEQSAIAQPKEAMRNLRAAQQLAIQLTSARPGDVTLRAAYVLANTQLLSGLIATDQTQQARQVGEDALAAADNILAQRPQYGAVLDAKQAIQGLLANRASLDLNPAESLRWALQQVQGCLALAKLEPANSHYVSTLIRADENVTTALWSLGRLREAIGYARQSVETLSQALPSNTVLLENTNLAVADLAYWQEVVGDRTAAAATIASGDAVMSGLASRLPAGGARRVIFDTVHSYPAVTLAYEREAFGATRDLAHKLRINLQGVGTHQDLSVNFLLYNFSDYEAHAEYMLGDFATAERSERTALEAYQAAGVSAPADVAQMTTWLSMALAREGKRRESAQTIAPIVAAYRTLSAKNHGDQWMPLYLAGGLFAQSLTDEQHASELLGEAQSLIEHLAPTVAQLHDTDVWRKFVQDARRLRNLGGA